MFKGIKEFWGKNRRFFTFDNSLNLPTIIFLYIIALSPFYLFSYLINKNFFSWTVQLDFLGTAWLPLLFYFEFVLLGYIQFKRKGEYPKKIIGSIQSKKEFVKSILKNNYNGYKIELSRVIMFLAGYFIIDVILFKILNDIYFGDLSKFIVIFLLIISIKLYLIFFVSDLISHSKLFRSQIFYSFIGLIFSDFIFLGYRLLFEQTPQVEAVRNIIVSMFGGLSGIISAIPGSFLTVGVIFLIGIAVVIFLPQKKIRIYGSERMSFVKAIFFSIFSTILFSMLIIMSFISPKAGAYTIEPLHIGFVMREFFFLGFLLFLSLLFLSRSMGMTSTTNTSTEFCKVKGIIEGFSAYSNKRKITQDYSFDSITEFFSLKDLNNPNNAPIEMAMPKRNLFSPINNQLYVNDEVEIMGFFFKTNDLNNPNKTIKILIPLILKVTKFSKLRQVIP